MMTDMPPHYNPNYPRLTDADYAAGSVQCWSCGVRIILCQCGQEPRHWASWAYGATFCTGNLDQHQPGPGPDQWRRVDTEWTDEERAARLAEADYVAKRQAEREEYDRAVRAFWDEVGKPLRRLTDWLNRRGA